MSTVLLCSENPLFIKSLYGMLRSDGYEVETVDRKAGAVQMSLERDYAAVVMDSAGVGLSAEDAARIIAGEAHTQTILVGAGAASAGALVVEEPFDVERVRMAVRSVVPKQFDTNLSRGKGAGES